ncbi:hypothetical protein D7I39_20345 [Allopusillimonas ginsengisoli]|nr:hypothetical protein D7I39_20345 [Allopusillimonas ginsengisoli]
MTYVRTFLSIAILTSAALATSAWASTGDQHDGHHATLDTATQVGQAQSEVTGATAPDYAGQMKDMQQMHSKMISAKTSDEHNALMAEHMKLMQGGMNMMGSMDHANMMDGGMGGGMGGSMGGSMGGGMGADAATDKPADIAARQGLMEQRMDMMLSMMQMMIDRMQTVPATK